MSRRSGFDEFLPVEKRGLGSFGALGGKAVRTMNFPWLLYRVKKFDFERKIEKFLLQFHMG